MHISWPGISRLLEAFITTMLFIILWLVVPVELGPLPWLINWFDVEILRTVVLNLADVVGPAGPGAMKLRYKHGPATIDNTTGNENNNHELALLPERPLPPPPTRFLFPLAPRLPFLCFALHTSQNHVPSGGTVSPIQVR